MTDLNDALNDLRTTITEDGFSAGLVETIASDYDLNPALLERKFTEKYGRAPSDYSAVSTSDMERKAVARAHEMAQSVLAEKYTGESSVAPGQIFERLGKKYVTVGLSNRGLVAISTDRLEETVWTWGSRDKTARACRARGLM